MGDRRRQGRHTADRRKVSRPGYSSSFIIAYPEDALPPLSFLELRAEDSPCKHKCDLIGPKCTGCLRTIKEIEEWSLYDPHERWQILARIFEENPELLLKKK